MEIRKRIVLLLAMLAIALAAVGTSTSSALASPVSAAKPCSAGYVHATLSWGHKCLRAGQFCASRYDSSYHRYGYHCHTGRLKAN